jgi:hypothetical protein
MGNEERWDAHWREAAQDMVTEHGSKADAVGPLADYMKEWHEKFMPELRGVWAHLIGAALAEVDWREIAEHWIDDCDEPEPDDDDEPDDSDGSEGDPLAEDRRRAAAELNAVVRNIMEGF